MKKGRGDGFPIAIPGVLPPRPFGGRVWRMDRSEVKREGREFEIRCFVRDEALDGEVIRLALHGAL